MVAATQSSPLTALKMATGIFHDLELYPDRLVVKRKDLLSRIFGHDEVIYLTEIDKILLYRSQMIVKAWAQLVIITTSHHSIGLSYRLNQLPAVEVIKETVEDYISRRAVMPYLKTLTR